jgi:hypothetical protein
MCIQEMVASFKAQNALKDATILQSLKVKDLWTVYHMYGVLSIPYFIKKSGPPTNG